MSWILNLYKTYEACKNVVGICGDSQASMLLPIGHLLTKVDVVVYLSKNGSFQRAEKTDYLICVPCTDESEGRSGPKAIDYPHPLFDQLRYYATQKYRANLKEWLKYLKGTGRFPFAEQAISAVYQYILKDSIYDDLKSYKISAKEQSFTAYCVNLDQSYENRLWCMPEIWNAWIEYYFSEIVVKKTKDVCYVTGLGNSPYTENHPKSINRFAANAKLITGNDDENFTFRGRFEKPSEAVTVSYEASQKAHQALRWLISKPNCYRIGSQAIIAWAIDDVPDVTPFYQDSRDIYSMVSCNDEEKLITADSTIYVDYGLAVKKALYGYNSSDALKKHKRHIAVMSTDAATKNTGRLSVTYYRELMEDEYIEKITQWHDTCKWFQPYGRTSDGQFSPGYFIGAPSLDRITLAVLGKRRKQKDESYEKAAKNLREQLLHCIFDGERIPLSIVQAAYNRVSNPFSYENNNAKRSIERWGDWECALGAASALIRKYYYDKGEVYSVELDTNRDDRDYLYGRLLAIADDIESCARYKQGKTKDEAGVTNAIRYMTVFAQNPYRTWNMLFTQQLNPYIQQLNGAEWHIGLVREIMCKFKPGAYESNAPLEGLYLLGFFAQKQKIYEERKKKNTNNDINKEETV